MNSAVIGLGSNIDPERNIEEGRKLLASSFKVIRSSRFLRTQPQGNPDQAEFINGCVLVETPLSQSEVKSLLRTFEEQMGRTPQMHCNKPRIIDFDIHAWNGQVIDPFFYKWDFIRSIVLEVVPDVVYER